MHHVMQPCRYVRLLLCAWIMAEPCCTAIYTKGREDDIQLEQTQRDKEQPMCIM